MKYELTITVAVSESSERRAIAVVERQLNRRGLGMAASEVTFIDGEALTPGQPECCDCGAILPAGSEDYGVCTTCAAAQAEVTP